MLWVIFTDKILAVDKPGIIILMAMSAALNIFICWLVDCRCKNKQRQNEQFGGKRIYVKQKSVIKAPKHTSCSSQTQTTVIINGNNNHVRIEKR